MSNEKSLPRVDQHLVYVIHNLQIQLSAFHFETWYLNAGIGAIITDFKYGPNLFDFSPFHFLHQIWNSTDVIAKSKIKVFLDFLQGQSVRVCKLLREVFSQPQSFGTKMFSIKFSRPGFTKKVDKCSSFLPGCTWKEFWSGFQSKLTWFITLNFWVTFYFPLNDLWSFMLIWLMVLLLFKQV